MRNLVFNNLWDGVCEGENGTTPTRLMEDKEIAIWNHKGKKTYALIYSSISEEVSHHIISITDYYGVLKKL